MPPADPALEVNSNHLILSHIRTDNQPRRLPHGVRLQHQRRGRPDRIDAQGSETDGLRLTNSMMLFIVAIMTTINSHTRFDATSLVRALGTLSMRLRANSSEPIEIVVCGGSALIHDGVVPRTTLDVDILALVSQGLLRSPDPLPESVARAARETAEDLGLPSGWLNNGPSRGPGGLFQMGLPTGIHERWTTRTFGTHLTVHLIGRVDQIYLKLYAAADRGGYHIDDLLALEPSDDELVGAASWAMTHDVSEAFRSIVTRLLRSIGHDGAADRL